MERVQLDGVDYVKASVVAKDFGYTSDYIGQLCRADKLDAKLVGRTWYVKPESVEEHQNNKYSTRAEPDDTANNKKPERIAVDPVIKNKTAKALDDKYDDFELTKRHLRVYYESDDESLMPHITRKYLPPKKSLRVEPANAKKLRVLGKRTKMQFEAEDIPEFALSGKLSVSEAEAPGPEVEADPEVETTPAVESEAKPESALASTEHVKVTETAGSRKAKVPFKISKFPNKTTNLQRISARQDSHTGTVASSARTNSGMHRPAKSSVNAKNQHHTLKFSPSSVATTKPVKINSAVMMSPLIATVFGLLVVSAIFSSTSVTVVSQSSYQSGVEVQTANLMNALNFKK